MPNQQKGYDFVLSPEYTIMYYIMIACYFLLLNTLQDKFDDIHYDGIINK